MSDWGQGAVNGIGWGQGAKNLNGWGSICLISWSGDTILA
jgi:hypothetical protein